MANAETYLQQSVVWQKTERAEYPYQAEVAGQQWKIRLNDFPAEIMYSLLIDGTIVAEFDDWPSQWIR